MKPFDSYIGMRPNGLSREEPQGGASENGEREAAFRALEAEVKAAKAASVNFRYSLEKMKLLVAKAVWTIPAAVLPLWWRLGVLVNRNARGRRDGLVETGFALKVIAFEETLFRRVRALERRLALLDIVKVRGLLLPQFLLEFEDERISLDAVVDVFNGLDKAKNVLEALMHGGYAGGDFDRSNHVKHYTTEAQGNA